jgi:nucleotidyltransferase/DNA polymerase involved in DNA repair
VFVSTEPTIIHADLDAFFASVEQRDDPRLRGRPVIVGPGVVQAASYEARARGVGSGMGAGTARRLCPEAIVVEPRWEAYVQASRDVFAVFREWAPLVEGLSIDEAFLDVRGLEHIRGSPRSWRSPGSIEASLYGLADRVTQRMRAGGAGGRTVTLRLRFADFSRATRSYTVASPVSSSAAVRAVASHLLASAMPLIRRRGLTMIGIAVSGLDGGEGSVQLELPLDDADRGLELDLAMDQIRSRFGPGAITRASLVGHDPGLSSFLSQSTQSGRGRSAPRNGARV